MKQTRSKQHGSDLSSDVEKLRHSLSHLLAAAVLQLYPGAKRAIGPAIENGFYFDFELPTPISDADLPKIEAQMRKILPTWDMFSKEELTKEQALAEYPHNPYKAELIEEFAKEGEKLSFYKSGDYHDLCRGGHVDSMKSVDPQSFKLTHTAGAYWRGNEKNTMLTRIYGLAFATKQELDEYQTMIIEAEKRDHRKLGPLLDLFVFSDLVGSGLPLWTPKGTVLRNVLDDFVWSLRRAKGYERVEIPHITKKDLYIKSGHWDKFKDELFRITTREGHEFAMKPMNCPHHTQIFKRKMWSYRDMPQRYANTTMCYRDEQTGELNGLSRVRSFTQDDAHVFCRPDQAKEEMLKIWEIVEQFYGAIGFDLRIRLSFHDPEHADKYLGDAKSWKIAEDALSELVKEKNADAMVAVGEAAFYGPKVDFMGKDSLGREWQVATIQLDMNLPERFDLTYVNDKGEHEQVVMIHAAIMGSIERYLAIVIEHFAGAFPLWLAPEQVVILPITDKQHDYAKNVFEQLQKAGLRVRLDSRNETLGKRIRENEIQKVPYTLIVGDKEIEANGVAVRHYKNGDEGVLRIEDLMKRLEKEITTRL